MKNGGSISHAPITLVKTPVYKWEFRYFKNDNLVFNKENAPNIFYRFMQQLILGVHWKRIGK